MKFLNVFDHGLVMEKEKSGIKMLKALLLVAGVGILVALFNQGL